jgi:hypothetical protein
VGERKSVVGGMDKERNKKGDNKDQVDFNC